MPVFEILISFFIAWVWVDYFRLIDIFNKENFAYIALVFFSSALLVLLVFNYRYTELFGLGLPEYNTGNRYIDQLLETILNIGLIEELLKFLPFILLYPIIKTFISEPIDIIAYMCISGLGFSAAENSMYFYQHGPEIISERAILSTVSHMIDSSYVGYGLVLYSYKTKKITSIIGFFILAIVAHGLFDFIIFSQIPFNFVILTLYFFLNVSLFSAILTNSLNNSPHFSYARVVNPNLVTTRMIIYYAIIILVDLFGTLFFSKTTGLHFSISEFIFFLIITLITIIRLSRFKLIKGRWNPLKIELPFTNNWLGNDFRIKGDGYNETIINSYFNSKVKIQPVRHDSDYLVSSHTAQVSEKYFDEKDNSYYLLQIYDERNPYQFLEFLIQAKTDGVRFLKEKYPIVKLYKYEGMIHEAQFISSHELSFIELAYIKPYVYHK